MIEWLFDICCKVMSLLGNLMGLSYKEVCVIFNIYVQGGMWFITALAPIVALIWKLSKKGSVGKVLYLFFAILYALFCSYLLFVWVDIYTFPLNEGFDICLGYLECLAKVFSSTYEAVNIYVFVIGWIISVGWNLLITKLILNGKTALSFVAMVLSQISILTIIITIVDWGFRQM